MKLYADVRVPADNLSQDECHYSDWSSCSYYCGDPPVEKRYQTLVDASPKESRALCLPKEEPCGNIDCTGNNAQLYKQSQINLTCAFKAPFVFGDWEETELCSETCGKGKLLVQRTCTPAHPDKSCASLETAETLKPGKKTCKREPCKGDSKVCLLDIG